MLQQFVFTRSASFYCLSKYKHSCTPVGDFRCVYPYEFILSNVPVQARGKDKERNSRTLAACRSVTSL